MLALQLVMTPDPLFPPVGAPWQVPALPSGRPGAGALFSRIRTNGRATTLAEAKAQFETNYRRWLDRHGAQVEAVAISAQPPRPVRSLAAMLSPMLSAALDSLAPSTNTRGNILRRSSATGTRPSPSSCRLFLHDLQDGMGEFQLARRALGDQYLAATGVAASQPPNRKLRPALTTNFSSSILSSKRTH